MTTSEQPADPPGPDTHPDAADSRATADPLTARASATDPGSARTDTATASTGRPAGPRSSEGAPAATGYPDPQEQPRQEPTTTGAGGGGEAKGDGLFPQRRTQHYTTRWEALKGGFVDEPRHTLRQADQLVGDVLEELHELFGAQRESLEHGLDADQTSTEDLRLALGRYRSFFDRLLSL